MDGSERALVGAVRVDAVHLTGGASDYDALLDLVGDARIVLLGEASHGTHEFARVAAYVGKRPTPTLVTRYLLAVRHPRPERPAHSDSNARASTAIVGG